jgi:hypothetical protein
MADKSEVNKKEKKTFVNLMNQAVINSLMSYEADIQRRRGRVPRYFLIPNPSKKSRTSLKIRRRR